MSWSFRWNKYDTYIIYCNRWRQVGTQIVIGDIFNDGGGYWFINACRFYEYVTKQTGKLDGSFISFYYYLFNKFTYLLPSFVFHFIWAFFFSCCAFCRIKSKVLHTTDLYVSSMLGFMILFPYLTVSMT